MCFRALLYAVFHSIRIGFAGSKRKIVDQKRLMVGLAKVAFNFSEDCVLFLNCCGPRGQEHPCVSASRSAARIATSSGDSP